MLFVLLTNLVYTAVVLPINSLALLRFVIILQMLFFVCEANLEVLMLYVC